MPFSPPRQTRALRLPQILSAIGLSAAALLPSAFAQTAPSFTAGPDDLMRVLPSQLLPALQADCHGVKIAAPAWPAQLDASATLLTTLNQVKVPEKQAALPMAMLCPAPSPLAAAWSRAAEQAGNLVKLDFPGAPGQVSGASFLGPQGSRVLLVNRSTLAVRVKLGTWVAKDARLDQYTQGGTTASPPKIDHLRRALGTEDAQGVLLPPMSLSVVG
ncbi:hypothetical protein [Thiomonas intermedia]|uniref:hypothetical protein n=1 Tax=Thiomonas intermedia TaxID=926 RepID=UPI0009A52A7A|nr:hypothetical protein [Thiomonas intermedia]